MADRWIVIPNWPKFQHYRDRTPPWIKLYLELRGRDDWRQLSLAARGLLVSIWIEYAASDGQLRSSDLPRRIAQKIPRPAWDSLLKAGFVRVRASKPASRPLATRARAREVEKEKESPLPQATKNNRPRTTGWRLVRGSHGMTHVRDPKGTDRPPPEVRT